MKYKILILFLFFTFNINAQVFQNENCTYSNFSFIPLNNNRQFNKYINKCDSIENKTYNIPVKFWIIRNDKGQSKIDNTYLKELIQYLNYYYSLNNTGIRFSLRPDFEYINKSKLLNLSYYRQAPVQSFKRKSKACINVIIANNLFKSKFLNSRKKNFAGTYNPLSRSIIISRKTSTSTLSHEIGHYLGLKHPHRGWKHKWFQEPVSRTRTIPGTKKLMCEHRGDGLCDTPAEPNLSKYTDSKCNYTGWNVKDKYGEVYKPNTHNIMSYTNNRECRNNFTKEQIMLMQFTLSKNKYSKYWRTDLIQNKKYLPDAFEPDNYKETANQIFFNTPQIHSFNSIYTGTRKEFIYDKTDWLYFELKTSKKTTVNINFNKTDKNFPEILISVFNNKKLITEKVIKSSDKTRKIVLKEINGGKYFIKIHQIVKTKKESFYKIIIEK